MTSPKRKTRARKPTGLWGLMWCEEANDGTRYVCHFWGHTEGDDTARSLAWLQRVLKWQREGRR
jgi:hypothetical protein